MNSIIYKNPVISALFINTIALILFMYSIYNSQYWMIMPLTMVGIINRRIIDNGQNMDKRKKNTILISLFFMIICLLWYSVYMLHVKEARIINGL